MFSKKIVDADRFLDLPPLARLLYFELGMRCDDDGFCAGPGAILRMTGLGRGDLDTLCGAGLVLDFGSVVVLRHWRVHNCLKADRLQPVAYPEIAAQLWICTDGTYEKKAGERRMNLLEYREKYLSERKDPLREMRVKSSENAGNFLESKDRIGEVRKEEDSPGECSAAEDAGADGGGDGGESDRLQAFGGTLGQGVVYLTDRQVGDLLDRMGLEEFDRYVRKLSDFILKHGASVRSHYQTLLRWWRDDRAVETEPEGDPCRKTTRYEAKPRARSRDGPRGRTLADVGGDVMKLPFR